MKTVQRKGFDSPQRHELCVSLLQFGNHVFKKLSGHNGNETSKKFKILRQRHWATYIAGAILWGLQKHRRCEGLSALLGQRGYRIRGWISVRLFSRKLELPNDNVWRYFVANVTQIDQEIWEVWAETHLRIEVKYGFCWTNFHETHTYSAPFSKELLRRIS